jgi:2,3-bisphosphoglycerate-independent phosphoglycerate mutase
MGNSEVGHLTIGAGRRLYQDLMRVNKAIADGSFFDNPVLREAFARGGNVHLLGLVSHGGVHSDIAHVQALLALARSCNKEQQTYVHAFTDGRDVSPTSAVHDLAELPLDRIATVVGRYYAMDRDERWDRTDLAANAVLEGVGTAVTAQTLLHAVQESYDAGVTDEFLQPLVVEGTPRLEPGDVAIFFNFRSDRGRQLSQVLLQRDVDLVTMTRYAEDIDTPVVFPEHEVKDTLAEILSRHGLRQLHVAETEKYPHVTYFFNGGREDEWPGETRIVVPSPRDVPSYDFKPEMSAREVSERFCEAIGDGYAFAVVNFANPDMVGHTGSIPAVIEAIQTTDTCLGEVVEAVTEAGGVALITADHGNSEQMLEPDGVSPHTAHTTNPVPLVVTDPGADLTKVREIADLAPLALLYLGLNESSQRGTRSGK